MPLLSAKCPSLLADGKTPYERRFGEQFKGPVIPFGAMVKCHPVSATDHPQVGKKVFPGIFLGYVLYTGGIWKGDILVADIEELEMLDESEIHTRKAQCKGNNYAEQW